MTGTRSVRRFVFAAAAAAVAFTPLAGVAPGGAQAPAEWNVAMVGGPVSGTGATIAIVDSGVDLDHYAFGGPDNTQVLPGYDFVENDSVPDDRHGHGTHVAGIAAGVGIDCNGPTAIGVAPGAKVMPVRVLDHSGDGTMANVIKGIDWAVAHDATVINLSLGEAPSLLGLGGESGEFLAALTRAWNAGSIPVLAAGNNGGILDSLLFPQGYGNVDAVVVTAVTAANGRADYAVSASSARWGIAAPGGDSSKGILSALDRQGCGTMSGTSMAAPHVSGALALLRARGLSPQEAVDRLLSTAAPSGSGTGAGLVDLDAALAGLSDPAATTTSPTTAAPTTASTTTETPTTSTPPTTVDAADADTDTEDASTTSADSTTTTEDDSTTTTEDEGPSPADDETSEASELTLDGESDSIPGALAVAAALGVTATWLGWLGVLRRRFL